MTPVEGVGVAVVGVLAGAGNAVAGGGTLISFPALLAMGLPPVTANVTSSVGLLSGYAGGSVAYRRELSGQNSRMLVLGMTAALGSIAGALLLLVTPGDSFRSVVPFLVLISSLLLLVQPALARKVRESEPASARHEVTPLAHVGVLLGAGYGSYFGAGLGVLLLGVLGILLVDDMQRLNGLKTLLSLLIKSVGAAIFVFSGHVSWSHAAILFLTAYSGGVLGAAVSRRLSPQVLRWSVAGIGVSVAAALFVTA